MNRKYYAIASLVAALSLPAVGAFAQAVGSNFVTVTSSPNTTVVTPGSTGTTFSTITLTGSQPGTVQISSLPVMLTSSGGVPSNLSNCQLFSNGGSVTTGTSVVNSLQNGSNTFTFNTPITVSNTAPVTLSLRCDASSATPSGSTFSFMAGSPNLAPTLAVNLTTSPAIAPGESAAPVAIVTLSAARSGSTITLNSLPISTIFNNGASASNLSNCRLYNSSNLDAPLNANSLGSIAAGGNTIALDQTLSVVGGGLATTLVLTCDVSTATPVGGSVQFAINPSSVTGIAATTGAGVSGAVGNGTNGAAGSLSGTATVVSALDFPPVPPVTPPTTPGVPNTGAGGNAGMNYLILTLSALLALGGAGVLVRAVQAQR